MSKKSLLWFRNDLRMHDHQALFEAAEQSSVLLPVNIFDPQFYDTGPFGFPRTGGFRYAFICDSLRDLHERLKQKSSGLLILEGKPEEIIPKLCREHGITHVYYHAERACEEHQAETELDSRLSSDGIESSKYHGGDLFHQDDIPYDSLDNIPDVFTTFRKKTEKYGKVRPVLPEPENIPPLPRGLETGTIPDIGIEPARPTEGTVLNFKGGETAALQRLNDWIWDKDQLRNYKYTRNGLLGADYSSKFSPWLAVGAISPRKIYEEVKRYEQERVKNVSTYWLIFELIWRDYFRFSFGKHGCRFFFRDGIKGKTYSWNSDSGQFEKWRTGTTGIPQVDANMRELNQTGFMSNRGRQWVACFLAKNLKLDWRLGAYWFETQLIDYDVYSNWGNWAYNAGVGNDPRNRYFNFENQAQKYDKKGDYIREWIPELKNVPADFIHHPWEMPPDMKKLYECTEYPNPMIDLEKSYAEIRNFSDE